MPSLLTVRLQVTPVIRNAIYDHLGNSKQAKALELLRGLGHRCRGLLLSLGRPVSFPPEEIVYRRGDPAEEMYLILEGGVLLEYSVREDGAAGVGGLADDRRERGFGELFGESALLPGEDGRRRLETAIAASSAEPVQAMAFTPAAVDAIEAAFPDAARRLRELATVAAAQARFLSRGEPAAKPYGGPGPAAVCPLQNRILAVTKRLIEDMEAELLLPAAAALFGVRRVFRLQLTFPPGMCGKDRGGGARGASCVVTAGGAVLCVPHSIAGIAETVPVRLGVLLSGSSALIEGGRSPDRDNRQHSCVLRLCRQCRGGIKEGCEEGGDALATVDYELRLETREDLDGLRRLIDAVLVGLSPPPLAQSTAVRGGAGKDAALPFGDRWGVSAELAGADAGEWQMLCASAAKTISGLQRGVVQADAGVTAALLRLAAAGAGVGTDMEGADMARSRADPASDWLSASAADGAPRSDLRVRVRCRGPVVAECGTPRASANFCSSSAAHVLDRDEVDGGGKCADYAGGKGWGNGYRVAGNSSYIVQDSCRLPTAGLDAKVHKPNTSVWHHIGHKAGESLRPIRLLGMIAREARRANRVALRLRILV